MLTALELAKRKSLLIVEDNSLTRKNYYEVFQGLGYEVFEAENGLKASILFAKQKPDLVITDIHMPVMDGLKLIRNIRRVDHETPIIVISSDEMLLKFASNNGANEKHLKTKNISNLIDSVELLLGL